MTTRLFKYATASIGLTILKNRTLRWRAPDWFNDPFEFKSPFEYGFEWDEMMEAAVRRLATILTQPEEPRFVQGYQSAPNIADRRRECKGRDPAEVYEKIRFAFAHHFEKRFKEDARSDAKNWHDMKQTYRVLCLSAVHDHILMWSHYADGHRGVVLELRPIIERGTATLFAHPVVYSTEVPVAATLEEYVGFLTGEKLKPDASNAFEKSAYTKSSVWNYENEWRILDKSTVVGEEPFADRVFYPQELAAVFLGCRMLPEDREAVIATASNWETPVLLSQMKDERIRFELTSEPIKNT
jgi:hypothetical protein